MPRKATGAPSGSGRGVDFRRADVSAPVVNGTGFRKIGVMRHPTLQLIVSRAVGAVQIALRQHVAEQDVILKSSDRCVGGRPCASS